MKVVQDATSYYVQGYRFSEAYKKRRWDGKKHLFNLKTKSMPAGLATAVTAAIREDDPGARVTINDCREQHAPVIGNHGFELDGVRFEGRYDFQLEAAKIAVAKKRGILKIATNGGKTEIACAITKHLAVPTVFLVPGLELLYQARDRFVKRLGLSVDEIGIIGDSEARTGLWITVATVQSLSTRLQNDPHILESARRWQLVFSDECHTTGSSETGYEVMDQIPAYYRFGLSGTPLDRSDGADLRLIAQTGEIIYEVPNKLLVERGISVQPYVEMVRIDQPQLPKSLPWSAANKQGVIENVVLNTKVVEKAREYANDGCQVLVMVDLIKHGTTISKLLQREAPELVHQFINGKEDTETRQEALRRFAAGEINVLLATSILDQGVDTPAIDVLIFAGGGKAKIRTLQRAGRGLRRGKNKDKLVIVDFANFTHKYLTKHSLQRLKTYKSEDCFLISTGT